MTDKADYDKSATPTAHKTSHQDGGTDEISAEGLAGELTAEQKSSWSKVSGKPTTFAPEAHKTSHQDGGTDEISVEGLAGELAAEQKSSWAKVSGKPTTFAPEAHKASHQPGGSDDILAIPKSIVTAAGDMIYATAAGVLTVLAKGSANLMMFMNAGATAPEWSNGKKLLQFTRVASAEDGDVAYTGFGFKPSSLIVVFGQNTISGGIGVSDSTKTAYCAASNRGGDLAYWHFDANIINCFMFAGATQQASAIIKSYDTDGFTLTWTGLNTPTGTITFNVLAFR